MDDLQYFFHVQYLEQWSIWLGGSSPCVIGDYLKGIVKKKKTTAGAAKLRACLFELQLLELF